MAARMYPFICFAMGSSVLGMNIKMSSQDGSSLRLPMSSWKEFLTEITEDTNPFEVGSFSSTSSDWIDSSAVATGSNG
eukprot:CAMPEP_0201649412 /NCGR_PEP_ID=MMETSP0493-20130528/39366_1 /ASSEMBLY_ACC=CAM_ASM_000838 /TAXON_ID=420259 /ORGANISM="Thalassiosira gravida, Strain GMp14c1" /LENGTH=77 /DNA_ID=CAMNT_0048125285 /DNA_START=30 /DNA_END=263 /DNA_ORIENTATION=-